MQGIWGMRMNHGGNAGNGGGNAENQGDSLREFSCLLLRLKFRSARGVFHHPTFIDSCQTTK